MVRKAVIMAGGEGRRMRPLTEHVPKPLVEIAGKPLLQILVEHLRDDGVEEVVMALGYKGDLIRKCFGDGRQLAVRIDYTRERERMGTAGALSLLNGQVDEPFYLVNGDILTTARFSELGRFHQQHKADVTVGVVEHEVLVPYGVVQTENGSLLDVTEKPILRFLVLAGIYVIEPEVLTHVTKGKPLDMPDLIQTLLHRNRKIAHYTIRGEWMDVGTSEDLHVAQRKVLEWGLIRSQRLQAQIRPSRRKRGHR